MTYLGLFATIAPMLSIRLQRTGRKNAAQYRVVITDSKNSVVSNRFQEVLGWYDPKSGTVEIKKDRALYWLGVGAQPTGTVHNFLVSQNILDAKKKNVLPKKSPTKKRKEK